MDFKSDDEDEEYVHDNEVGDDESVSISETEDEEEIDEEEVKDNIINTKYVVNDDLLSKSQKILRDGKELVFFINTG
jgi:hypothetical protein